MRSTTVSDMLRTDCAPDTPLISTRMYIKHTGRACDRRHTVNIRQCDYLLCHHTNETQVQHFLHNFVSWVSFGKRIVTVLIITATIAYKLVSNNRN